MPSIAIVCDWLTNYGGAERVIESISDIFPSAPIYTSLYNPEVMTSFRNRKVIPSFIQKIPWAYKNHRPFLKLMPYAFEKFYFGGFDIVISSSHSCAKGIITKPETLHISYCHNPMRYAWDDFHSYISDHRIHRNLKNLIYYSLTNLRVWDRAAADRVDYFIANSFCVQKRIEKYYRRQSEVIYPPVDTSKFSLQIKKDDYYLAVGRLIPYKKFDCIVEAFNALKLPLKIIGVGSELKHLKKAAGNNIEFLNYVDDYALNELYGKAKALIFPQVEDLGLIPLEAMACGTTVICYAKGGALETVIDGETGIYFHEQTPTALISAINRFETMTFDPKAIRKHSKLFDQQIFTDKMLDFVEKKWNKWNN